MGDLERVPTNQDVDYAINKVVKAVSIKIRLIMATTAIVTAEVCDRLRESMPEIEPIPIIGCYVYIIWGTTQIFLPFLDQQYKAKVRRMAEVNSGRLRSRMLKVLEENPKVENKIRALAQELEISLES